MQEHDRARSRASTKRLTRPGVARSGRRRGGNLSLPEAARKTRARRRGVWLALVLSLGACDGRQEAPPPREPPPRAVEIPQKSGRGVFLACRVEVPEADAALMDEVARVLRARLDAAGWREVEIEAYPGGRLDVAVSGAGDSDVEPLTALLTEGPLPAPVTRAHFVVIKPRRLPHDHEH